MFKPDYYVALWQKLRDTNPKWLLQVASSPYERLRVAMYSAPPFIWGDDTVSDYTSLVPTVEITLPVLANLMLVEQTKHQDELDRLYMTMRYQKSDHFSQFSDIDTTTDEDGIKVHIKDGEVNAIMIALECALKKADQQEDWLTYDALTSMLVQCRKAGY